ncbi:MAG TPA: DUF2125 domain-containing protein [Dongiaceae bacterium]|jgi:hypothetical protein
MTRRSRRFVWTAALVLLLAALAGGYVCYRSYVAGQLTIAINNWILARTAEGYRIDADIRPESGGLSAVSQRLSNVVVAAPGDLWMLRMNGLDISISPLNPFDVKFLSDGNTELTYTVADEIYILTSRLSAAGFSYDREGQFTAAYLQQIKSRLDGPVRVDFDSLESSFRFATAPPSANDDKSVEFIVRLENATVSQSKPLPLGNLIEQFALQAYATGKLRPGRPSVSLAAWRDDGGVIQIQQATAVWGPLAISAEGTLALDTQMQPLFAGTAYAQGYNEAIDALAQAGYVELGQVTAAKIALAAMSKPAEDGRPPTARLPITIQDGFLFVGPLKLAQMPRIVWQ